MENLDDQIQQATDLIGAADNIVVLTGAEISIPSGIPDFRSPASGLWGQHNPMEVASIIAFRQNPAAFYEWVRPLAQKALSAKPNAAHDALADLEAARKLKAVVTQNIDGLHQAAGSKCVFEVHGHSRQMTCLNCFEVYDARPIFEKFAGDGQVPHCHCGGVLKPNVILFGEHLPLEILHQAKHAVSQADLLIVAGSSLEVAPISDLPLQSLNATAKIIIINSQSTYLDDRANLVIRHDLVEVLPKIAQGVLV